MADKNIGGGEILLYRSGSEAEIVSVMFKGENCWRTQKAMAERFDCTTDNISLYLKNIFVSHDDAVKKAGGLYAESRKKQDADYISEFDRETAKYCKGGDPK